MVYAVKLRIPHNIGSFKLTLLYSIQVDQLYMAVCFWYLLKSVPRTVTSLFTRYQNNMAMFIWSGCIVNGKGQTKFFFLHYRKCIYPEFLIFLGLLSVHSSHINTSHFVEHLNKEIRIIFKILLQQFILKRRFFFFYINMKNYSWFLSSDGRR